jgi:hypothetical protein
MTILQSELVIQKPATISNTSSNGGHRVYENVAVSASQNFFDHVFSTERASGSTRVRFGYCCNHNASKEAAYNFRIWIDNETAADDYVYFMSKAQGATNASITGSEQIFTVGNLKTDVAIGATAITITLPTTSAADTYARELTSAFVDGGTCRISTRVYPDSTSGNSEFFVLSAAPTVVGSDVTMTLPEPGLLAAYTVAAGARVSNVYEAGTVAASFDTASVTGTVTADTSTYPPLLDNEATIEETWTITFLSSTTFTCSGARIGAVASGVTTTNYAPTNSDVSKAYFTLESEMWGGTPVAGDKFVFTTRDSSKNIAVVRIVPVGAGVFGTNRCTLAMSCESAS